MGYWFNRKAPAQPTTVQLDSRESPDMYWFCFGISVCRLNMIYHLITPYFPYTCAIVSKATASEYDHGLTVSEATCSTSGAVQVSETFLHACGNYWPDS